MILKETNKYLADNCDYVHVYGENRGSETLKAFLNLDRVTFFI